MGLYILLQRRRLNKYINTDSTIENPLSNFEESGINLQGLQEAHQQKEEDQEQQEEEYQQPQQHSQQELSTFQAHESFSSNEPPADVIGAPNLSAPEAVAARAYCKYALLFFIALLITWVSSQFTQPPSNDIRDLTIRTSRSPHQRIESMHYVTPTVTSSALPTPPAWSSRYRGSGTL